MVNVAGRSTTVVAAIWLTAALVGCSAGQPPEAPSTTSEAESLTLRGTVTLGTDAIGWWREGEPCGGGGGYDDLRGGAPVVVRDASGTTVAQGELHAGELRVLPQADPPQPGVLVPRKAECDLDFRITVPGGSDFYEVTFASRDPLPFTADDLREALALTIG